MIVAVVLGGSDRADPLAQEVGVAAKALVPIGGRPMASYVLEALRESEAVSAYLYVGSATPELHALATQTLVSGKSLTASLRAGLEAAEALNPERILAISADLPWLTARTVDTFVQDAPPAAAVYPIIPKEVAERQFPGQKRTYANLKEGAFTGGNAILLEPRILTTLLPFVDRAYEGRKNPLSLARLVGVRFALKLLVGKLAVTDLERRIGEILGMSVRAVQSRDAALGADVDTLEHIEAWRKPI